MTFSLFMTKASAFLLSIFMTLVPYMGFELPVMKTKEADCQLNLEMISDIHIEAEFPFRTGFLKQALRAANRAPSKVDGIVVSGDLTNYADEPSLAKYYETITDYTDIPVITAAGNHDIGHAGDRNKTDITRNEALANVVKYQNAYAGTDNPSNYYSQEINGYKFIVIGDEVDGFDYDENGEKIPHEGGRWDGITMTEAQLEFLDSELAEGTKEGKPVFVVSHWALDGINGEDIIWDGSGIAEDEYPVREILEKYDNVFYISGHMHGGVRCTGVADAYDIPMAEQVNGVTYISLPSFGLVNQYGLPMCGRGAQLEVYGDKVIFRPMNYLTGNFYTNSACSFELTKTVEVL